MAKEKKSSKNKSSIASKVVAVIIAIALITGSSLAVAYLLNRGKNAMRNYSGNQTIATEEVPTGHIIEEKDMPSLNEDDGKSEGYIDGAVYIWNNKGYEIFKGTVTDAKLYATSINNYKRILGNDYKVYNAVVPSSTEIALPQRLSKTFSNNQRENISTIITNLSEDVTPVDVYNILGEKRNENLYYHTEKYLTPIGAYYGYTEIIKSMNMKPTDISQFSVVDCSKSFIGSYVSATVSKETQNGNPKLLENPDTVQYYALPSGVTTQATKTNDDTLETTDYFNEYVDDGTSPYSIYNTTDCSCTVLTNSSLNAEEKIAIVTDKCGYAIAPFFSSNFGQVHIIDIDNFNRNIKDYLTKNKITNVLYLNGITSANTAVKTAKMDAMF